MRKICKRRHGVVFEIPDEVVRRLVGALAPRQQQTFVGVDQGDGSFVVRRDRSKHFLGAAGRDVEPTQERAIPFRRRARAIHEQRAAAIGRHRDGRAEMRRSRQRCARIRVTVFE